MVWPSILVAQPACRSAALSSGIACLWHGKANGFSILGYCCTLLQNAVKVTLLVGFFTLKGFPLVLSGAFSPVISSLLFNTLLEFLDQP